jgi:hypothetical protein
MSVVTDMVDGAFGLVALVVGIVAILAAHGFLSGWVLVRGRALGPSRALREGPFVLAGALVLASVAVFVWLAREFAANPP